MEELALMQFQIKLVLSQASQNFLNMFQMRLCVYCELGSHPYTPLQMVTLKYFGHYLLK